MEPRKRVLIVDDDVSVLKGLSRALEDHADVSVAIGAQAAFEHVTKLAEHQGSVYDVAIIDFNLVGSNGAWLLERLQVRFPDCRRILVSGSHVEGLDGYVGSGLVHEFLEKPFDVIDLVELLRR